MAAITAFPHYPHSAYPGRPKKQVTVPYFQYGEVLSFLYAGGGGEDLEIRERMHDDGTMIEESVGSASKVSRPWQWHHLIPAAFLKGGRKARPVPGFDLARKLHGWGNNGKGLHEIFKDPTSVLPNGKPIKDIIAGQGLSAKQIMAGYPAGVAGKKAWLKDLRAAYKWLDDTYPGVYTLYGETKTIYQFWKETVKRIGMKKLLSMIA